LHPQLSNSQQCPAARLSNDNTNTHERKHKQHISSRSKRTARVERGIAAAVDEEAASLRPANTQQAATPASERQEAQLNESNESTRTPFGEVAVRPDVCVVRVAREVGAVVQLAALPTNTGAKAICEPTKKSASNDRTVSPQNLSGIDGNGVRHTSSPRCSITLRTTAAAVEEEPLLSALASLLPEGARLEL
jgi:hypothetical protein